MAPNVIDSPIATAVTTAHLVTDVHEKLRMQKAKMEAEGQSWANDRGSGVSSWHFTAQGSSQMLHASPLQNPFQYLPGPAPSPPLDKASSPKKKTFSTS
jgi:hypothetical protein